MRSPRTNPERRQATWSRGWSLIFVGLVAMGACGQALSSVASERQTAKRQVLQELQELQRPDAPQSFEEHPTAALLRKLGVAG